MNLRDKQYHEFFTRMGYEFVYYPEKSGFLIKEIGYAKVCDYPAPKVLQDKAEENGKKQTTILLEGPLSFKPYSFYSENGWTESIFIPKGEKYYPVFWQNEYDVDIFPGTSKNIGVVLNGGDVVCQRCGSVNDFQVQKPSIHYKAVCQCGCFIKNLPTNQPAVLYFGKYQGREVASMRSDEELRYLQWLVDNSNSLKGRVLEAIKYQLAL